MKLQYPKAIAYFNFLSLLTIFLILGGCEKMVYDPLNTPDDTGTRGGDKMAYADGLSEGSLCSRHSLTDEDLSFPQLADDLFRGISLSGHGLASIILTANPNLRLGPVFGGKVIHSVFEGQISQQKLLLSKGRIA